MTAQILCNGVNNLPYKNLVIRKDKMTIKKERKELREQFLNLKKSRERHPESSTLAVEEMLYDLEKYPDPEKRHPFGEDEVAITQSSAEGQSSTLYYEKLAIPKDTMIVLKKKRCEMLEKIGALKQNLKINRECASHTIEKMHHDLEEHLKVSKESQEIGGVKVPACFYDGEIFTLKKLYEEWHTLIIKLITVQREVQEELIEDWFKILSTVYLENYAENDSDETADQVSKYTNAEETEDWNSEESTDQIVSYVYWFIFVVMLCTMLVLFLYNFRDIKECVKTPLECMQSIILKFCSTALGCYVSFHNITLENETLH